MNSINFTYFICDQAITRILNDFSNQIWNCVSAEIELEVWDQVVEQILYQIQGQIDDEFSSETN